MKPGIRFMRFAYRLVTGTACLFWRLRPASPAGRRRARQRRGDYRADALPPAPYWIHAVSVGEAAAACLLVRELMSRRAGQACVLACHTPGGRTMARRMAPAGVAVVAPPLDGARYVRRMLREVRPQAILVLELELWPHLWLLAREAGIPLVLCNGRMPERELAAYRRLAFFFREMLSVAQLLCVQDEAAAAGYRALAPEAPLCITGNLKFDQQAPGVVNRDRDTYLVVLGSVHREEEGLFLELAAAVLQAVPEGGVVLAPRAISRGDVLARRCRRRGLSFVRRSQGATMPPAGGILLLDTIGELTGWYGRAAVAVLGGSFSKKVGGHNPLEPAVCGTPVLFGPWMDHFAMAARVLLAAGGARQVSGAPALVRAVLGLLQDRARARRMGRRARAACLRHRGATTRTVDAIFAALEG